MLRKRFFLEIKVFVDVYVKYVVYFGDFEDVFFDIVERGLVDVVVVSGKVIGRFVDVDKFVFVKEIFLVFVIVGFGMSYDNFFEFWKYVDGFIVGMWIKCDGRVENEVFLERVRKLVEFVKEFC